MLTNPRLPQRQPLFFTSALGNSMKLTLKIGLSLLAAIALCIIAEYSTLSLMTLTRIDPLPHAQKLVAEKRFAEADVYLDFFTKFAYVSDNDEIVALHKQIKDERSGIIYNSKKAVIGFITGESDENIGKGASAVSDFLVIGDLRDLGKEGWKYIKGEETDEVMLALSAIGVAASATQIASYGGTAATGGAAAPAAAATTAAKSAVITLKIARRLGKLPKWLLKKIMVLAKAINDKKKIHEANELFKNITALASKKGGLELLSKTNKEEDLEKMKPFVQKIGDHSLVLYELTDGVILDAAQPFESSDDIATLMTAATYGKRGVKMMTQMGAASFAKTVAKDSGENKSFYKKYILAPLVYAILLPYWLLWFFVLVGIAVWLPWRRFLEEKMPVIQKRLLAYISRPSDKTP